MNKVETLDSLNELRLSIGLNIIPKDIIAQCELILLADKDNKEKTIHLDAVGVKTIGQLLVISEILKSMIPGLSQKNIFSLIHFLPNEKGKKSDNRPKRIFPKLEITLSTDGEVGQKDSSSKISEDETTMMINAFVKAKKSRKTSGASNVRRWRIYSGRQGHSNLYRRTIYSMKKVGYNYRRPFCKIQNGFVWKSNRKWINSRNMKYSSQKNEICPLNDKPNTLNKNSDDIN